MPEIEFEGDNRTVHVASGVALAEVLNVTNSPILFGCRTGICGTCIVEIVSVKDGVLPAADEFEAETLEMFAPGNPRARLPCQMDACVSMKIKKIEPL